MRQIIIPNIIEDILDPKRISLQDCASNLISSNTIRPDTVLIEEDLYFLNEEEYLAFLRKESGCSLVRSLSDAQREAFLELACICQNNPDRFTVDCCEGGNANVDISGAQKPDLARSPAERAALQNICDVTEAVWPDVCAPPPTPEPTRSPPLPVPVPRPVAMPVRVTTPEIPTGQSAPAPMAPRPTIPPLIEESESCRTSLTTADANRNNRLDVEEFLNFVRNFSVCNYIEALTFRQRSVFTDLACGCSDDPQDPCCAIAPQVPLADDGWGNSVPAGYTNFRARICAEITPVLESTCIPPTPEVLVPEDDLEECATALRRADDGDEVLDREEFVQFTRRLGGCDLVSRFDFAVVATFYAFSCTAAGASGAAGSLCFTAPLVNISGVAVSPSERSPEQTNSLSELCASSAAIVDRECAPLAVPSPIPEGDDCVDSLIRADLDGDNGLDRDEFFRFLQNRTAECSELEQPTAAQKVVFAVLSCSCVFETRSLLCCLGGAARIRLDGAILDERDRERQDNAYLSIACRASEVTAFSCAARTQQQLPTSTSGGAHPRAGFARYFVWATMMLAVVLLHL